MALLAAGCSSDKNTGPSEPGVIQGQLVSSLGGPLAGLNVTITPSGKAAMDPATTDTTGNYSVNEVPVGTGTITVSGVPDNCTAPSATPYTIARAGETITANMTVSCTATTGNLTVVINADTGVTPDVEVAYPDPCDFRPVDSTTTLTNLAVGSYRVYGNTVTTTGAIVSRVDTAAVTGSPVALTAGASDTVTVAYALSPAGSGAMWVTNGSGNSLARFAPSQLGQTGTPDANASIVTGDPVSGAVDAAGRIWVANFIANDIAAYGPEQLMAGGTPTPAVTLAGSAVAQPYALAFDAQGNLWAAMRTSGKVVEFSASQLVSGGVVTPAVTLSGSAFNLPSGLAFDADGNLWVVNYGSNSVAEFTPEQLAADGTPTPLVTISSSALVQPIGIAFAPNGTLWVSNMAGGTASNAVGFSTEQLSAGGSVTPALALKSSDGRSGAFGLAFDNSGDLWVAFSIQSAVVEFSADQVASGGAVDPAVVLTGDSLIGSTGIVFDPRPLLQPR